MSETKTYPIEIKLPSGKVASVREFKGRDAMQAQKRIGTDTEKYIPTLIAMTTTIDGQPIVVEDLEEMDGRDYMKLFTAFSESAFM